mmetsp:Transcript_11667/g.36386  ORF Transcript_11667/g.36386 Transcript_11667/m.36386 type:complete len:379 (-) Transcript_11667:36-1172(-)
MMLAPVVLTLSAVRLATVSGASLDLCLAEPCGSRLPVAVAVTVTGGITQSPGWRDGLAVFAHAARRALANSSRRVDLLALVPDSLPELEVAAVAELGLTPRPLPVPVLRDDVQSRFARWSMAKFGCCGDLEGLKYYGAALLEYERVLVLDADVLLLEPIDEIFDIPSSHALVGTYNHNLDISSSVFPAVQGGFLLFSPSLSDFQALVNLTREGDYRAETGWKGSNTGWVYGGVGPQGLLSFYYNQVRPGQPGFDPTAPQKGYDVPGNATVQPPGSRFLPLDHSVYNVLVPDLRRMRMWAPWKAELALAAFDASRVKAFHFSGLCQKPWQCVPTGSLLCEAMTSRWWELRAELAGGAHTGRCRVGAMYEPLTTRAVLRQ